MTIPLTDRKFGTLRPWPPLPTLNSLTGLNDPG